MKNYILILLFLGSLFSCASGSVVVLKTGKGFHSPTQAGVVDILTAFPQEKYEELGVVSASNFEVGDVGKMHNALRDKASTLGADAVVITNQGILPGQGLLKPTRWSEGTAIKWVK